MVTLNGVVVAGDRFKGDSADSILQVQKINGQATQECIEVPIRPYSTGFGEPYLAVNLDLPQKADPERSLPRLEYGVTYEFWGYETGGFAGEPAEAGRDGGMGKQYTSFYFASTFVVVKGKKGRPIAFSPGDFIGQKALVHGRAANHDGRAWLMGRGWQIELLGSNVWPESILGTRLAVTGVLGRELKTKLPQITKVRVRHDCLGNQVDRQVELRGEAIDRNGFWYLRYNGHDILVEEDMDHAAKGSLDLNLAVEVRGLLRKERLPDKISGKSNELKEQYIVRQASCTPIDDLLPIERAGEPCLVHWREWQVIVPEAWNIRLTCVGSRFAAPGMIAGQGWHKEPEQDPANSKGQSVIELSTPSPMRNGNEWACKVFCVRSALWA